MKIKEIKKLRENLGFTHIVLLGIKEDGTHELSTHGKTITNANEAAILGNKVKEFIGWPPEFCKSKPLERVCGNCDYLQENRIRFDCSETKCMVAPQTIERKKDDRACEKFEPKL